MNIQHWYCTCGTCWVAEWYNFGYNFICNTPHLNSSVCVCVCVANVNVFVRGSRYEKFFHVIAHGISYDSRLYIYWIRCGCSSAHLIMDRIVNGFFFFFFFRSDRTDAFNIWSIIVYTMSATKWYRTIAIDFFVRIYLFLIRISVPTTAKMCDFHMKRELIATSAASLTFLSKYLFNQMIYTCTLIYNTM